MRVRSLARVLAPLVAALMAGCDGSTGNDGSFTMTLSSEAMAVPQGASTTITVSFVRADFDGPISLGAEGLPTGVTATFSPNPASGASVVMQLSVAATTTPGTTEVTVRATADGPATQTATFDLIVGVAGSFTLGALDGTLTVAQGGGDRTSILVNRSGGFTGSVAVTVTGAPAGLTTALDNTSTTGNSVSLTLGAAGSVPVGTYTLTATGSSAFLSDQQTTLTVNVIAPPATATLTMTFCANSIPTFLAYKNEGSGWAAASPTGNAFTFAATDRLAVATAFLPTAADRQVNVSYGLRSEFANFQGRDCVGDKTVTGSVAGLSAAQQARVALGPVIAATPATNASPNFSITGVPARTVDLVAAMGITSGTSFLPEKFIVRRDLDPAPNAVLPVLDFAAAEAFAPQPALLTIGTAAPTEAKTVVLTFWSANNTFALLQRADIASGTLNLQGVPAARMVAGDLHELYLDQFFAQNNLGRSVISYFGAPADRTDAFGPFANTPAVTTLATQPYLRLRARAEVLPEYASAARILFYQQSASDSRAVFLQVSALYLGGAPATWDLSIPDLTGTPGFSATWMPVQSPQTLWQYVPFGGRADLLSGARPAPGDMIRYSDRTAIFSGGSALRAPGGRPALPRSQYFRR